MITKNFIDIYKKYNKQFKQLEVLCKLKNEPINYFFNGHCVQNYNILFNIVRLQSIEIKLNKETDFSFCQINDNLLFYDFKGFNKSLIISILNKYKIEYNNELLYEYICLPYNENTLDVILKIIIQFLSIKK